MTLVEVMMALTVLTIVALGVLSTISISFSADRSSQRQLDGQSFAQEVMETVKATPYSQVLSLDGTRTVRDGLSGVIRADLISSGLIRVEVEVTDDANPAVSTQLVTAMADLD